MRAVPCRSCGAPVIFGVHPNGSRMPFDAEPVGVPLEARGLYWLKADGPEHTRAMPVPSSWPVYRPHWGSCPDADSWRSRRAARPPAGGGGNDG